MSIGRWLCLSLLPTLLAGCGGGTTVVPPGPQPPTVTAISPLPDAGGPDETVTFSGTATNSPTSWRWDFGGGATPNATNELSPAVRLKDSLGTFTGTVTARNAYGTSAPFTFTYRIAHGLPRVNVVLPGGGPLGAQGKRIEFAAIALNHPNAWEWEFGGGATPNTSTDETPQVRLNAQGEYTGRLIVHNDAGTSTPFGFTYAVGPLLPSPVFQVFPSGRIGDSGDQQNFSASLATAPPQAYHWNFGTGATPPTSDDSSPVVTLGVAGIHEGTLQLETGDGFTEPFPFTYMVEGPAGTPPPFHTINIQHVNTSFGQSSIAVVNGRPVLAFSDYPDFQSNPALYYAAATTPTPSAPEHWIKHQVVPDSGWVAQVIAGEGDRPFIAHLTWNFPFVVQMSLASSSAPTQASDWLTYEPFPGQSAENGLLLGKVAGRPAVTFPTFEGTMAGRTSVALPDGPEDWSTHVVDPSSINQIVGLQDLGGKPAIAVIGGPNFDVLVLAAAKTANFNDPSDWSISRIDGPGVFNSNLVIWNGRAAAGYTKGNSFHVAQAKVALPVTDDDWTRTSLLVQPANSTTSAAVVNGKLAIVYSVFPDFCPVCLMPPQAEELRIAWNAVDNPQTALDWQTASLQPLPMNNLVTAVNNGTLLIAGYPTFFFPGREE